MKPVISKFQTGVILVIIAAIGMIFSLLKQDRENSKFSGQYSYPVMGTVFTADFFEPEQVAEKAAKAVFAELKKIENMCNIFDPESEISKLNSNAANAPFICSCELYSMLVYCRLAHKITGGAFDITAKPLMDLWGFYRQQNNVPTTAEIKTVLTKVGMDKVKFNDQNNSVFFTVPGMAFDLGGVAKGAALDAAVKAARNAGAENFILNLGGNIACRGKNKNGRDFFEIGIRDPRKRDAVIDKLHLSNAFCATSGDYERFVVLNGRKYSHIMNPLTGYPVQNMCSVTVVADKGIDSDIFSTACFILGSKEADRFIQTKKINDVCSVSIAEDNSFSYSHGFNHITKEVKK